MAEFGKLNFSTSFNPTSAFPLDARYYFESYDNALAAAETAKEVGSSETVYFYGENLVVVDSKAKTATMYVIQPPAEGVDTKPTLKKVGADVEFDATSLATLSGKTLALTYDGTKITFEESHVADDATVTAVKKQAEANKTAIETLNGEVGTEGSVKYTATQIVNEKIAAAQHLQYKIVADTAAIDNEITSSPDEAKHTVYLVPKAAGQPDDGYDEYMVIEVSKGDDGGTEKKKEKVGDWGVDLTAYQTTAQAKTEHDAIEQKITALDTKLDEKKVDKVSGKSLIDDTVIEKLEALDLDSLTTAKLDEKYTNKVTGVVTTSGLKLTGTEVELNEVAQSKVTGLNKTTYTMDEGNKLQPSSASSTLLDILVPAKYDAEQSEYNDGLMTAAQVKQLDDQGKQLTAIETKVNNLPEEVIGEGGLDKYIGDKITAETTQIKADVQSVQEAEAKNTAKLADVDEGKTVGALIDEKVNAAQTTLSGSIDEINEKLEGVDTTVSDLIDSKIGTATEELNTSIAEAKKAGTDAKAELDAYKKTNDAAVQAAQAKADEVDGKIGDIGSEKTVAEFVTKKVGDLKTELEARVTDTEKALTWGDLEE